MSRWCSSGVSIITTSAQAAASATPITFSPSASAFFAEADPGRSATATSPTPLSRRFSVTHRELRRYRDVIAPLAFDAVLTPFEYAPEVGRDIAVRLLDAALARRPGVTRVPL